MKRFLSTFGLLLLPVTVMAHAGGEAHSFIAGALHPLGGRQITDWGVTRVGAPEAWSLGYRGNGVKVGIFDSGIDVDHPDLRVVGGVDLVGDGNGLDDCNGHGTHVAGIVGANGTVKGVAPGVTFGAYRVFGCAGSTTSDIMVEAMERALADDMDVLNMSIGSSFQWPQYPTAQAADRLVNKGMVVVASIGNSGTSGLYAAGAPGVEAALVRGAEHAHEHLLTVGAAPVMST